MVQTILGAGGVIGIETAKELYKIGKDVRLVSRNPKAVSGKEDLHSASLLEADQVMKALEGTEVAYLTVGYDYKAKVWQEVWPKTMDNVLKACEAHKCKLVFFDNIYLYHPDFNNQPIGEENTIAPKSEKGKVRAKIALQLMDAVEKGKVEALIARAPDFYGPGNSNSVLVETVFKNFQKGKAANWLGDVNCKHSFIYTPDAGKATALLGNSSDAYNQVWHLPTAQNPPTGKEWIEMIAAEMNKKPKIQAAPKWMVRILGLFNPIMKEFVEMMYQYEQDYVFDSSKFEKAFNLKPTSYEDGVKEIVKKDFN